MKFLKSHEMTGPSITHSKETLENQLVWASLELKCIHVWTFDDFSQLKRNSC